VYFPSTEEEIPACQFLTSGEGKKSAASRTFKKERILAVTMERGGQSVLIVHLRRGWPTTCFREEQFPPSTFSKEGKEALIPRKREKRERIRKDLKSHLCLFLMKGEKKLTKGIFAGLGRWRTVSQQERIGFTSTDAPRGKANLPHRIFHQSGEGVFCEPHGV